MNRWDTVPMFAITMQCSSLKHKKLRPFNLAILRPTL